MAHLRQLTAARVERTTSDAVAHLIIGELRKKKSNEAAASMKRGNLAGITLIQPSATPPHFFGFTRPANDFSGAFWRG